MCTTRVKQVLDYAEECLAGFRLNTAIPRDLVNEADDTLISVFGIASKEVERYTEYRDQYNAFEKTVRRRWLESLRYDLKSALTRLEATPARRYPSLGLGAIENEGGLHGSISARLGLQNPSTKFQLRMAEICKRIQVNMQFKCFDAAAFLLRKMLEAAIVERFRRDKRFSEVAPSGQILGLETLLKKASLSSGGYVDHRVVKELGGEKVLMDISVHAFEYDPSPDDIYRAMSFVKAALQGLSVSEL